MRSSDIQVLTRMLLLSRVAKKEEEMTTMPHRKILMRTLAINENKENEQHREKPTSQVEETSNQSA